MLPLFVLSSVLPKIFCAEDHSRIRVLTYNVWYGFTKKSERKSDWLAYVKSLKPDVVALQELNGYSPEQLAVDAKFWGHKYTALLKEDGFPTGITSKFPIGKLKKVMDGYHHGMLSCKTGGIQIYNIHFHPGHWEIRHREVDLLLKTLQSHVSDEPVLWWAISILFPKGTKSITIRLLISFRFFADWISDGKVIGIYVMTGSTIPILQNSKMEVIKISLQRGERASWGLFQLNYDWMKTTDLHDGLITFSRTRFSRKDALPPDTWSMKRQIFYPTTTPQSPNLNEKAPGFPGA